MYAALGTDVGLHVEAISPSTYMLNRLYGEG